MIAPLLLGLLLAAAPVAADRGATSAAAAAVPPGSDAAAGAAAPAPEAEGGPDANAAGGEPDPFALAGRTAAPVPMREPAGGGSLLMPALALGLLAAAALLLARRKRRAGGILQVVETVGLGPRRSLVVVRVGDELLLLGSSEAGIHLVATRPADAIPAAAEERSTGRFDDLLARLGAGAEGGR